MLCKTKQPKQLIHVQMALIYVFHKQSKNLSDKCTGIIFAILFFFLHIIALQ